MVDLIDEDAVPNYKKISEKVIHLRRLGMTLRSRVFAFQGKRLSASLA